MQRELAEVPGVTVLIYDQTCAAEKRRRRKRGNFPDPDKRVIINELVCEGCGDCGVQSNCVSVQPLETEWGRKRTIDQSSCNKDFSCVKGFCPSFVTVHGATLKKGTGVAGDHELAPLPEPDAAGDRSRPYNIIVTGVGGTGVVTVGGILGMAAHLEGKGVGVLDMAGLAQKGGAVFSHIRIAAQARGHSCHPRRGRRAPIWCSAAISSSPARSKVLAAVKHGATQSGRQYRRGSCPATSPAMPISRCRPSGSSARSSPMPAATRRISSTPPRIANALFGHSIGANMFMVGYRLSARRHPAVGRGDRAGDRTQRRGRRHEPGGLPLGPPRRDRPRRGRGAGEAGCGTASDAEHLSESFEETVERRVKFLTAYQNAAYARRYRALVDKVADGRGRRARPANAGLPTPSRAICSS